MSREETKSEFILSPHTNNVLDFTAHQRTCKISWSPWATIPWTIDSLASTSYRTRFTSHILLGIIFRCLCVYVCFATWERRSSKTRGVSHCGLAIYIEKYVKAKEELWKLKYFTKQTYNLQKMPLKILQDIITLLELISSFNTSQNIIFQKSSYKNRPYYYLGAKIP